MASSSRVHPFTALQVDDAVVVTRAHTDLDGLAPDAERKPGIEEQPYRNGRRIDLVPGTSRTYRSVWLSDIHLGTKNCKTTFLLHFLRHMETKNLYLVGDIIDGWALKKNWYWDGTHNRIVLHILKASNHGTYVSLVCGNHDEFLRGYTSFDFGGVTITNEDEHVLHDGRRLLITHGDRFDVIIRNAAWIAHLGDWAYTLSLRLNDLFNTVRRKFGRPYWSLSQYLKQKVKKAVSYIDDFEAAVSRDARSKGFDGVVCGHIHKAALQQEEDGFLYMNCGDWVESCTALVEHLDGRLELLEFAVGHEKVETSKFTHVGELQGA